MRFIICTLSGMLFSVLLFSQDVFKEGFVVKNNGDTIRGSIQYDIETKLLNAITFRNTDYGDQIFTLVDIQSFGFTGADIFRSVSYNDQTDSFKTKTHFARLLYSGRNDLLSFVRKDVLFFVVKAGDGSTYFLFDDITSASGQIIDKGNYANQLFFLARSCDPLRTRAENIRYSEAALLSFFESFDKCTGYAGGKVYYIKPELQKHFYFFAGGMPLGNQHEITVQALVKFVLPSRNRKTSLNTGIVYLRNQIVDGYKDFFGDIKEFDHVVEIYEVPMTIQYNFLEKAIQPYVYGGIGLAYKRETPFPGSSANKGLQGNFGVTLIGGAGIDIKLAKSLLARIDWRYDLIFHYPAAGIVYKIK